MIKVGAGGSAAAESREAAFLELDALSPAGSSKQTYGGGAAGKSTETSCP